MLISHHRASPQERLFSVYTFSLWTQFCKYHGIAALLLSLMSRRCYSRLSLYKVLSDWRNKLFPSDFPAVAAKNVDNMWTDPAVLQSAVSSSHGKTTNAACDIFPDCIVHVSYVLYHTFVTHCLLWCCLKFLWIRHFNTSYSWQTTAWRAT